MTIVTGDRYLDLLSSFVEENAGPLLDGRLVLKLNPVGLHYVQARLDALQELEALRVVAPVDYLRAYIADLGDHRALEQLRRVLRLLSAAKVVATLPAPSRDPNPVTLLPFSRLRSLELRGCDLSTSAARGLLELRPILETLVCYNSADALRHIFAERTAEIQDARVWSRLANVSCFDNGMLLMDESLQLLPAVEALDLSRNRFAKVANLHKCSKLKFLDAGFNHITTVASLNQILHGITKLVLRNNAIVSTRGLQRIASLEALDLSYNLISNFREVELLSHLPSLRFLWLEGNPVTFGRFYRRETLSFFADPIKVILDGRQTTWVENYAARRRVGRRLKQRSKYGAFSPALINESSDASAYLSDSGELSEDTSSMDVRTGAGRSAFRAKKRCSRLASIKDSTGFKVSLRTLEPAREGSFNSVASFDADYATQVFAATKEQIENTVLDLMEKAEVLRMSGSSTWLKDLNMLLDNEGQNKPDTVRNIHRNDSDGSQKSSMSEKRKKRQSSRKSSFRASNLTSRKSEFNSGEHVQETEASLAQLSGETSQEASQRYGFGLIDDEKPYLDNGEDDSVSFRLTEELVSGKMSLRTASPPQFNQDLLHRRQTLERERLQLPPEREISPSYDSESSSETIYSNFDDSGESPLHSPRERHPFTLLHGFGDPDFPSEKLDNERNSVSLTAERQPAESAKDDVRDEALTTNNNDSTAKAVGNESASDSKADSPLKASNCDRKDTSGDDNGVLCPHHSDKVVLKAKPPRRIVRLESFANPPSISQWSMPSDVNSVVGDMIHRSLSSPMQFSNVGTPSTESNLDNRSGWSDNEIHSMSLPSISLQKGENHEASESSLQFHRLHPVVGPFVGQCA